MRVGQGRQGPVRTNRNFRQADRNSGREDRPPGRKTRLRKRAWEVDREFRATSGCSGRLAGSWEG